MKTLYVVTAKGLETFFAWGQEGIEKGLLDLYSAQIKNIREDKDGDLTIEAIDELGYLPELTAEPHTDIYGEQKDD